MELIYDDKTGTWGEAPEAYGTIECATKEDYEYAKRAIKGYKEFEAKHWDECRQIAHYDDELKEARKLLTATKYKVKHEEWDMHGEHYIADYELCPNCNKCLTKILYGHEAPKAKHCPYCGQKIDWTE